MATSEISPPEFFKVYLAYHSEFLPLPLAFYRHLPQPLPETAILRNASGNLWRVGMMRRQGYVCFGSGWPKFAEDNELKVGEFMVFRYEAPRNFLVTIYGQSSCKENRAEVVIQEISETTEQDVIDVSDSSGMYPLQSRNDTSNDDDDDDDDEVILETPRGTETRRFQTTSGKKGKSGTRARQVNIAYVENAERYLDDPANPFFVTKLKNRNFELQIPGKLIRQYNLEFAKVVSFIDRQAFGNVNGKTALWKDKRVSIKNWNSICRRNKLKPEDKVICELLCEEDATVHAIKVHIIRG